MKVQIEVDCIDEVVAEAIYQSLVLLDIQFNELIEKDELETYQAIDLADNIKYAKALKIAYGYYNYDTSRIQGLVI